jgi:hypothetical protein
MIYWVDRGRLRIKGVDNDKCGYFRYRTYRLFIRT